MSRPERWFAPAKTVLLTGAGFTHTFGGYLASEMWAVILSQPEIRQRPKLRERMLDELNYETLYDDVMTSATHELEEKQALTEAIRRAYKQLHEIICRQETQHLTAASQVCQFFISRFAGTEQTERGFFFTLNQDLFIERFYTPSDFVLRLPGLRCDTYKNIPLSGDVIRNARYEAVAYEKIAVRGRTYAAYRIEGIDQRSDRPFGIRITIWYAPDVKNWIKFLGINDYDNQVIPGFDFELVSYKPAS